MKALDFPLSVSFHFISFHFPSCSYSHSHFDFVHFNFVTFFYHIASCFNKPLFGESLTSVLGVNECLFSCFSFSFSFVCHKTSKNGFFKASELKLNLIN